MVLITPEDCPKLDIPEIDAQHETMIGLVNQVHQAMLKASDRTVLDGLLAELMDYTRGHCAYEEQLMVKYDYPRYEAHKAEHVRLLSHLGDLIDRYRQGDVLLSFAVVLELKNWACIHIEKSDRLLGVFLNDRIGAETSGPSG